MFKISIVTVTYNCEDMVEDTILSVISQNYDNMEYIVIDGGSKDGTINIIRLYENYIRTFISEPDKGIFDAMNKSLDYVTGDYVLFLNAGDKFINDHVLSDVFNQYDEDDDLIFGDTYVMTKYGYRLRKSDAIYIKNASKRDYVFKGQGICHQSLFTKVNSLKKVKFDLAYPLGADYDTTAKIFFGGKGSIRYCEIPVAVFDDRNGGVSHYKEMAVFKERVKMFDYTPSIIDYFVILYNCYMTKVKGFLENCFPGPVSAYRKKKYSKDL